MLRNSDPNLTIRIDDDIAEVGSYFGCTVHRSPSDGQQNTATIGRIRSVRVGLGWYTEGRGDTDAMTVAEFDVAVDEFGIADGRVELPVPSNGPISYDGSLIRVRWRIRARTDIAIGIDQRSEAEVLVVPRGGYGAYTWPHPIR